MKFLFIVLLFSCNAAKNIKPGNHSADISYVLEKRDLYISLIGEVQDEHGFIEHDTCDSLLFTALSYYGGVKLVDLLAAFDKETGMWHRTPGQDCYAAGRSGSTISKDMLTGLLWAKHSPANEIAVQLYDYGKKNLWVMGEGDPTRTVASSNLRRTIALIAEKSVTPLPDLWGSAMSDHDTHINVLHILLRGKIKQKITDDMYDVIEAAANSYPENALFQFALELYSDDLDLSAIIATLADDLLFPPNRLPSSSDRCARWLWERAPFKWEPCRKERMTHSGGDLIFLAKLLEDSSRQID